MYKGFNKTVGTPFEFCVCLQSPEEFLNIAKMLVKFNYINFLFFISDSAN